MTQRKPPGATQQPPAVRTRDRFESYEEAQAIAGRRLPRSLFRQISGGIGRGVTLNANVHAFDDITFRPRAAVAVAERDISTTVLGTPISLPVLIAPVGVLRIVHPDGILAVARAAGAAGTICARSMVAGHSATEVAAVADGPLWQQLYMFQGRDYAEELIEEAKRQGYSALVVTVDNAVESKRRQPPLHMNLKSAVRYAPELVQRPRWTTAFIRDGLQLAAANSVLQIEKRGAKKIATWDDFGWIRESWPGPIIVKGLITRDDALRALDAGAAAVVVSNHGGFDLDGLPATIRALPEVVDAIGDVAEVLLDSGIRQGTDVIKAVAMGAHAVMIGRPYVMGLAVAGESGVRQMLELFRYEIDRGLGMLGCPSLRQLDPTFVNVPPDWMPRHH